MNAHNAHALNVFGRGLVGQTLRDINLNNISVQGWRAINVSILGYYRIANESTCLQGLWHGKWFSGTTSSQLQIVRTELITD